MGHFKIVLPDEKDQTLIHNEIIYQIKRNRNLSELTPVLKSLLLKYDLDSFITGCTEIHLLAKHFVWSCDETSFQCIDPLMIIAKDVVEGGLSSK
jgi:aspartate racemase